MAARQSCGLGRGPLLAWEKISTALYVHEWARQMKGCNPIFCYVNIRCYIGRRCWQTRFWTSHRGRLGVSQSEPSSPWCHEGFRSRTCIMQGKLLCKAADLDEGWKEKAVCGVLLEFSSKWSVGRGRRQEFAAEEINR